jgi:hypothetical protein
MTICSVLVILERHTTSPTNRETMGAEPPEGSRERVETKEDRAREPVSSGNTDIIGTMVHTLAASGSISAP